MDPIYNECPPKMSDARFLTDYRSSNTREQYIRSINGLTNTDDYRDFLQNNAEQIMDKEWEIVTNKNSCRTTTCVHMLPTRVPLGASHEEMKLYNMIQKNQIKKNDVGYPTCPNYPDYRMSNTKNTKY